MNGGSLIAENCQLSDEMIPVKKRRPTIKEEQEEDEPKNDLGSSQGPSHMPPFYSGFPGQMMWPASVNAAVQAAAQAQAQQYYAAEAAVRQLANTAAAAGTLPSNLIPTYPTEESLSNHLPSISNAFRSDRNSTDARAQQSDETSSGYSSHGSNSPLGSTPQSSSYPYRSGSATMMLPPDADIPMHVESPLAQKGARDLTMRSHQTLEVEVAKSVSRAFQMNIDEHNDTNITSPYDKDQRNQNLSKVDVQEVHHDDKCQRNSFSSNEQQRQSPNNSEQQQSPSYEQRPQRQSPHNEDRFKRGLKHHLLAHQDNMMAENQTPSVTSNVSDSSSPQSPPQTPVLSQISGSPRSPVSPSTRESPSHVQQSHAFSDSPNDFSGRPSHLSNNNVLITNNNGDITAENSLRQEQITSYENNNDSSSNIEKDLTKQENKDLRQQLLALSAEVAKMRSIVLGN